MKVRLIAICTLIILAVTPIYADKKVKKVKTLIQTTGDENIPDKRVEVYEIKAEKERNKIILTGSTTNPDVKEKLLKGLNERKIRFTDQIILLPDTTEDKACYGVVNLSAMNMRNRPSYSAEMVSQGILGMPVRILEKKNWRRVQTPDNYIGWVTSGSVQAMTKAEYNAWVDAPKVVFIRPYGFCYSKPDKNAQTVSDLVSGAMLQWEGEYQGFHMVVYPDGRKGFVSKAEAIPFENWIKSRQQNPSFFITTAWKYLGIPYLWGGTSPKGMDCSGFIKTIAFQNGLILSRDASQQAYEGERIETNGNFDLLLPGDFLFFGKKEENKERVVHVGLYLGNKRFIHAATCIKVGSFDPSSDEYDEYNTNRFLWATRIYNSIASPGIVPVKDNSYYQNQ
ncbi:MAG: C40 family peptidase [Bacteroidales bacterium]